MRSIRKVRKRPIHRKTCFLSNICSFRIRQDGIRKILDSHDVLLVLQTYFFTNENSTATSDGALRHRSSLFPRGSENCIQPIRLVFRFPRKRLKKKRNSRTTGILPVKKKKKNKKPVRMRFFTVIPKLIPTNTLLGENVVEFFVQIPATDLGTTTRAPKCTPFGWDDIPFFFLNPPGIPRLKNGWQGNSMTTSFL